jgi:hypothetical protein
MKLPPWKSSDPEDQRALARFIIAELDRADEAALAAANDGPGAQFIGIWGQAQGLLARIGLKLPLPEPAKRPGPKPKDDLTDIERAALDVPRIRALFQLHWNKRNRTMRPMAEDIAAERWELSAGERAKLINRFRRKP